MGQSQGNFRPGLNPTGGKGQWSSSGEGPVCGGDSRRRAVLRRSIRNSRKDDPKTDPISRDRSARMWELVSSKPSVEPRIRHLREGDSFKRATARGGNVLRCCCYVPAPSPKGGDAFIAGPVFAINSHAPRRTSASGNARAKLYALNSGPVTQSQAHRCGLGIREEQRNRDLGGGGVQEESPARMTSRTETPIVCSIPQVPFSVLACATGKRRPRRGAYASVAQLRKSVLQKASEEVA